MEELNFDSVPTLNQEIGVKVLSKKENVKDDKKILVLKIEHQDKEYEIGMYGQDSIAKNQSKLYTEDNGDLFINISEEKLKSDDGVNWLWEN